MQQKAHNNALPHQEVDTVSVRDRMPSTRAAQSTAMGTNVRRQPPYELAVIAIIISRLLACQA